MAIDHIIDYDCVPKRTLTSEGILERLKGRQRAETIIQLFRQNDDDRPPSEMGFEFTRSTLDDDDATELMVVQDVLDYAEPLKPLEHHCAGCPANRRGEPFGCMSFVQYPISAAGEKWLLQQLPMPTEPLVWLLLKQGVDNFAYDGATTAKLRQGETYFEDKFAASRRLGEIVLDANQVFEMIFMVGHIIPNHGAILLLFFNALERSEMEAPEIMNLVPADDEKIAKYDFLHQVLPADDQTTRDIKEFLEALYIAWKLNVRLLVDA